MGEVRRTNWRESFRLHVIGLERFLDDRGGENIAGEHTVYLAGMIARGMDDAYFEQIENYLLDDPGAIDAAIRRHEPYIGQNAPIVTLSRINAEHLTFQLAAAEGEITRFFEMSIPTRYFGIASFYSEQAGDRTLSSIFAYFRNNLPLILDVLTGYLNFLEENGDALHGAFTRETWERLGTESNERNARKERLERMGLDSRRKPRISRSEFNKMIDFASPN